MSSWEAPGGAAKQEEMIGSSGNGPFCEWMGGRTGRQQLSEKVMWKMAGLQVGGGTRKGEEARLDVLFG